MGGSGRGGVARVGLADHGHQLLGKRLPQFQSDAGKQAGAGVVEHDPHELGLGRFDHCIHAALVDGGAGFLGQPGVDRAALTLDLLLVLGGARGAHLAIGAAFAVILLVRNHRVLQRYTYTFGLVALVLLLLPVVPGIGTSINGARVWIQLGSLTFQPGEVAKIALAIFFAGYLVSHRESLSMVGRKFLGMRLPRGRDLGPIIAVWILTMGVIVTQRDLGTGLLFFGLFLVMLYTATARVGWVMIGVGMIVVGALAANQFLGYVHGRFQNWYDAFNPEIYNADGGSYQVVQGLFGLAHGGLIGTGLGQGMPYITPVSQSDYIISSLGEELGLVGVFAILCMYVLLVARGLRIGFAIGAAPVIDRISRVTGPYDINSFAVTAAFAALRDQAYVDAYVAEVLRARQWISGQLRAAGVRHHVDGGNYLLIWPRGGAAAVDAALRAEGILVRSMAGKPLIDGALRVSLGTVEQMQRFWSAYAAIEGLRP